MRDAVRGACELLGLDPLHIANEGQFLAVVAPEHADAALDALQRDAGRAARRRSSARFAISRPARCWSTTRYGGTPGHRHAGRRSAAADLLSMAMSRHLSASPDLHGELRTAAAAPAQSCLGAFFEREAPRLARACQAMAERFLRGGRLLAFGRGPYATDAQHVSVEFVHPVIVGKRALAGARSVAALRALAGRRFCRPDDIVMGFGPPGGDPEVTAALDAARTRGALTFALPGTRGDYAFDAGIADPFVHQEMIEILYHTLWETVHVFFEHHEMGTTSGQAAFLYPFLGRTKQDRRAAARRGRELDSCEGQRRRAAARATWRRRESERIAAAIARDPRSRCARRDAHPVRQRRLGDRRQRLGARLRVVRRPGYRPIPAISLAMEPANITAIANDVGSDVDLPAAADRARPSRRRRRRHLDERRIAQRRRWRWRRRGSAACSPSRCSVRRRRDRPARTGGLRHRRRARTTSRASRKCRRPCIT